MANRQVIVLDASLDSTGRTLTVTFAAWLVAPSTRVVVLPNFASRVPSSTAVSWGVTSAELALLVAGTLVEQVSSVSFDMTAGTPTIAQMEAAVQSKYAQLQTALTSAAYSVAHAVGAYWDGTTWTAGP